MQGVSNYLESRHVSSNAMFSDFRASKVLSKGAR